MHPRKRYFVTTKLNWLLIGICCIVVLISSTKIGTANVAVDYNQHGPLRYPEGGWGYAYVYCGSGWSAVGGGFYVPGYQSPENTNIVTRSGPYGGNGWIASAHELRADGTPNGITVYVTCVKNVP